MTSRLKGWYMFFMLLIPCVSAEEEYFIWDDQGYLFFCLCMGRFGNQADHFLGGLKFAKEINRTLVVPPWRTYKNVPFTDWFRLDALAGYHRVISAEDFMTQLAPQHWPPGNRIGLCFSYHSDPCEMKKGNPFGPFWDELGIDFDTTENYDVSSLEPAKWPDRFPVSKYPVLALRGAPAKFPVQEENRHLQQYLQWSDEIISHGQAYIQSHFPNKKFLGLHLRNGPDWENACNRFQNRSGQGHFMASPQCVDLNKGERVTQEICFPSTDTVLRKTKDVLEKTGLKVVYIATDKNPLMKELKDHLKDMEVEIFHQDPWLPVHDVYVLSQADYFIGNCVSSFTAFVIRDFNLNNKPSSFWGL